MFVGFVSMIVFGVVEMAYGALVRGASPWRPLDVFGAVVLGQFGPSADSGHTWATTIAGVQPMLAVLVGVLFGIAMYYVDMYGFAWIFAPLTLLRGLSSLAAYAIQGGLAAAVYVSMTRAALGDTATTAGNDMRRLRDVPLA